MCCRLFSQYLVVKDIAKDFKVELRAGLGAELGGKGLFNLSILLLTMERLWI